MSKIARRLGRISTAKIETTGHSSSEALPTGGEGEGGQEEGAQSAGRSLKVPTPRMNQKRLKSVSTSHLESSHDRWVTVCIV